MSIYTCGIVEDEELARELITRYAQRHDRLRLLWCIDSLAAVPNEDLMQLTDIVFLDLLDTPTATDQISEGLYQNAKNLDGIIVTTAYPESFVKKLGINYLKILNKPFTYTVFEQVVNQAIELLSQRIPLQSRT